METKPVDVYSEASNFGIVRMPGRNYLGCVIQGDSLELRSFVHGFPANR